MILIYPTSSYTGTFIHKRSVNIIKDAWDDTWLDFIENGTYISFKPYETNTLGEKMETNYKDPSFSCLSLNIKKEVIEG